MGEEINVVGFCFKVIQKEYTNSIYKFSLTRKYIFEKKIFNSWSNSAEIFISINILLFKINESNIKVVKRIYNSFICKNQWVKEQFQH